MESVTQIIDYLSKEIDPYNVSTQYKYTNVSYHEPFEFENWPISKVNAFYYPYNKISLLLGILYLGMLKWGPKFMENRKPIKLQKPLALWNFFLSALSGFMFYRACMDYLNIWLHRGPYEALCLR